MNILRHWLDSILKMKYIQINKCILVLFLLCVEKIDRFINNIKKFGELYKETMKNISLDEHIETLVGFNFEDEIHLDK